MSAKLVPDDLPDVAILPKPVRKSLSMVPQLEDIAPERLQEEVEKIKAVAALSGFGQSHGAPAKARKAETAPTVVDTGRMLRRSNRTVQMTSRVQPETVKYLRDYANTNDMKFTDLIELLVSEFRQNHT